jgi:hypothetical protein
MNKFLSVNDNNLNNVHNSNNNNNDNENKKNSFENNAGLFLSKCGNNNKIDYENPWNNDNNLYDNNNGNRFKRLKQNESPENIRTDHIEENNSSNSKKSEGNYKFDKYYENKDFNRNMDYNINSNFDKNNIELNENSMNISNNTYFVHNRNISSNTVIGDSNMINNKNSSGTIFNYENFFDNLKKKNEKRREVYANNSNKDSRYDDFMIKDNIDKVIKKLNNKIENGI